MAQARCFDFAASAVKQQKFFCFITENAMGCEDILCLLLCDKLNSKDTVTSFEVFM